MKDADLRKTLAALQSPSPDSASRERALHRSLVGLAQRSSANTPQARTYWQRAAWRVAAAACGVAVVVGILVLREARVRPEAGMDVAHADVVTLAQMQALFPGQLNAVIEQDGEARLDLTATGRSDAHDQPLTLHLEGRGHRLHVLSYSGRVITLELNGARLTFEALVTGDGGVILSGDGFAWSSKQPRQLAGYRIEARALPAL